MQHYFALYITFYFTYVHCFVMNLYATSNTAHNTVQWSTGELKVKRKTFGTHSPVSAHCYHYSLYVVITIFRLLRYDVTLNIVNL